MTTRKRRLLINKEVTIMTDTILLATAERIASAASYMDIFDSVDMDSDADASIKKTFRALARVLHPDRYSDWCSKATASEAFVKLGVLRQQADEAVRSGRYGQPVYLATITSKRATHRLQYALGDGDICATYASSSNDGTGTKDMFVKIAKNPSDSDLLLTEALALKRLHSKNTEEKWQCYVPKLLDSFLYTASSGARQQANVTPLLKGFYSLDQLRRIFPGGIDSRHAVWIFRRLLAALGFAHDNNVIHGAVLPRHVMVLPEQHGVVLVDWCYASLAEAGQAFPPVKVVVMTYKDWYPEEVFAKRSPSPATDIVMAARSIILLLGGDPMSGTLPHAVPMPIRAFLRGCIQKHQSMRPQNAWLLLREFDELLETMGAPYFPRRFLPLVLPKGDT